MFMTHHTSSDAVCVAHGGGACGPWCVWGWGSRASQALAEKSRGTSVLGPAGTSGVVQGRSALRRVRKYFSAQDSAANKASRQRTWSNTRKVLPCVLILRDRPLGSLAPRSFIFRESLCFPVLVPSHPSSLFLTARPCCLHRLPGGPPDLTLLGHLTP